MKHDLDEGWSSCGFISAGLWEQFLKLLITLSVFFGFNITDRCLWPAYADEAFYSIQIASYKNRNNAAKQTSDLIASGIDAFLRHETVKGKGKWYRIYVGRYGSKRQAEEAAETLRQKNIISYCCIRTISKSVDDCYLHVSSYVVKIQAEDEVHRLEKHGFDAFFAQEEVSGERWFRVYIGPFPDEQHARRMGSELREKRLISFFRPKKGARSIVAADRIALSGQEQDKHVEPMYEDKHEKQLSGDTYYDLGVFAYGDGDFEDAEIKFMTALKFNPRDPYCNHYLGKTYLKMERYREAENYLNVAWKLDTAACGLKYDMAVLHYKMSNYTKAADLFAEIAKEDPSNALAHYRAGMSLYKLKRYWKAARYFAAAAEKSPGIKANSYYYAGICYQEMGETEKAIEKFEYVQAQPDLESLGQYASKWLDAIGKRKKALKPYSIYLKVNCGYDDNVRLEPIDDYIFSDEADYVAKAYFSGRYNLADRGDYKIDVGYGHYQTVHRALKQYDLVGSTFDFGIKYDLELFALGISYLPSFYWVDSGGFLLRHELTPELTWKLDENLSGKLSYIFCYNNYFQNSGRDGHSSGFFQDICYKLRGKEDYLFGGIGYDDNSASHPDYSYDRVRTKLGISLRLSGEQVLSFTGRYCEKRFDNTDSFYGAKRQDHKYFGSMILSRKLSYDWLTGCLELNYTRNNSNIDDYKYVRYEIGLSLVAKY